MMSGLSLSAAAWRAATSSTATKALSFLRKGMSELMLDEAVAVEVVGGSEREEGGHTHDDRAEHFVVDVEIVVGKTAPLVGEDTVVGVLGGIFRHGDAEGRSDLHAFERVGDILPINPIPPK